MSPSSECSPTGSSPSGQSPARYGTYIPAVHLGAIAFLPNVLTQPVPLLVTDGHDPVVSPGVLLELFE